MVATLFLSVCVCVCVCLCWLVVVSSLSSLYVPCGTSSTSSSLL